MSLCRSRRLPGGRAVASAVAGVWLVALPALAVLPNSSAKPPVVTLLQKSIDDDAARVWRDAAGAVREFRLWNGKTTASRAATFFPAYAKSLGLTADDRMEAEETGPSPSAARAVSRAGATPAVAPGGANPVAPLHLTPAVEHVRFRQTWKGIPVEWAQYTLTTVRGTVVAGHGHIATHIATATAPALPATTALARAMSALPGIRWAWVVDPAHVRTPAGRLRIYSQDFGKTQPFRLAWRFDLPAAGPAAPAKIHAQAPTAVQTLAHGGYVAWVDAVEGTLLGSQSDRLDLTETPASGRRLDGARVTFTTTAAPAPRLQPRVQGPATYLLKETTFRKIDTRDVGSAPPEAPPVDFTNVGTEWDGADLRRGVSAHWAAEQFFDLIAHQDAWYPFFDPLTLKVGGACVDDLARTYWPHESSPEHSILICSLPGSADSPFEQAHMVGHELTHLLNYYGRGGSEPANLPEPRAIEEGLSDAWGFVFSNRVLGANPRHPWTAAAGTSEERSFANPLALHAPATYGGQYWNPQGDPHANAMVLGHWFYLLVEGGAGTNDLGTAYDVAGLGMDTAGQVLLTTIRHGLDSTLDYQELRDATIVLATTGDFEAEEVAAAWDAVGVGDPLAADIPHWPSPGALAVDPWPLTPSFAKPLHPPDRGTSDEVRWRVQISTARDFLSDLVLDEEVASYQELPPSYLVPMTVYWWRVKAFHARDAKWDADWAFTSCFETSRAQPRDVTPADGATRVYPWPTQFAWAPMEGAASYEVELADDPAFTADLRTTRVTGPAAELDSRPSRTQYWRVRAWPRSGTVPGDWSTVVQSPSFSGETNGLERAWSEEVALRFETGDAAPAGLSPADGASAEPWALELRWDDAGAETYDVEIRQDGGAIVPHSTAGVREDGVVGLDVDLIHGSNYSWRVLGHRAGDDSGWSEWASFAAGDERVIPHKPVDDPPGGVCLWPARFAWLRVRGALSYDVEVAVSDATFQPASLVASAPGAALLAGLPLPAIDLMLPYRPTTILTQPLRYFWHVRAHGPNGDVGEWSNPEPFQSDSCTKVQDLGPTGTVGTHPRVTWSAPESTAIAGYIAQVLAPGQSAADLPYFSRSTPDFDPGPLAPGTAYRAQVSAVGSGNVGFGEPAVVSFTTAQPCSGTFKSGGNQGGDFWVDVGKAGRFTIFFNSYDVPDELHVFEASSGVELTHRDCRPSAATLSAVTPTGVVHIVVRPRCDPQIQNDTVWDLRVDCAR